MKLVYASFVPGGMLDLGMNNMALDPCIFSASNLAFPTPWDSWSNLLYHYFSMLFLLVWWVVCPCSFWYPTQGQRCGLLYGGGKKCMGACKWLIGRGIIRGGILWSSCVYYCGVWLGTCAGDNSRDVVIFCVLCTGPLGYCFAPSDLELRNWYVPSFLIQGRN